METNVEYWSKLLESKPILPSALELIKAIKLNVIDTLEKILEIKGVTKASNNYKVELDYIEPILNKDFVIENFTYLLRIVVPLFLNKDTKDELEILRESLDDFLKTKNIKSITIDTYAIEGSQLGLKLIIDFSQFLK